MTLNISSIEINVLNPNQPFISLRTDQNFVTFIFHEIAKINNNVNLDGLKNHLDGVLYNYGWAKYKINLINISDYHNQFA